ncbi:MAG: hypothetical protein IKD40_07365 [Bacteroidaceae bacterium]|nr:hypothetical protein [Bacteroidaceae bacterium]
MIYKFRLLSDEVENFRRDIEIDSEASFHDLHKAILEAVNYPDDQMTSFFLCNDNWIKEVEITLEDMNSLSEEESYVMSDTIIGDLIEEEKQHLVYVFDPLGDRVFFMELSKIEFGKDLDAPRCVKSVGDAPQQVLDFDALMSKNPIAATTGGEEFMDDFYGNDGYNDEDLDGLDLDNMSDMSSIDDLYS